jgi:ABC-type multidrug transport system ATPase subunit
MTSRKVLIKAEKLTKKYNHFTAVDHIDFEVYKGECIGFLGPNGAGKTTTARAFGRSLDRLGYFGFLYVKHLFDEKKTYQIIRALTFCFLCSIKLV